MSCARISGFVTLVVTAVVIISGSIWCVSTDRLQVGWKFCSKYILLKILITENVSCSMIWSRVGMNKIDIFGSKDLALLNKCMAQAGASQPVAYVCDPDAPFSCATTYAFVLYLNLQT